MIVVNAIVQASEETIEAMKEAIRVMEVASREEPGCLDYTLSVELSNPSVLRITEKWDAMASLEAHFQMPHMADFQQALAANPPESIDAKFYEVTEVPMPGQ